MNSGAIAEILGGKKVLGRSIKSFAELADLIRKGLPVGSLIVLGEKLDLKNAALSEKLGIPQRTLTRRLSQHSRLTATEMIGNADKAAQWLRTPNRALGGEIPIDQLDTDLGAKEIENILGRIAYGVYS